MNRRNLIMGLAAFVPCVAGLAGCATTAKSGSMGLMNSKCPMKPDCPLPEGAPTIEYKGGKVGFCCKGCINKWNAATDDQRAVLLDNVK